MNSPITSHSAVLYIVHSPPQYLDHPDFLCPDAKAFAFIAMVYRFSSKEPFPIPSLCRPWANHQGQLSFLRWAIEASPEIISFESSPRRALPVENLQGGRDPRGTPNCAWLSLDLIESLCAAADKGNLLGSRAIVEVGFKQCPEVLLCSFAAANVEVTNELLKDVLVALIPPYILAHPNSGPVMQRVFPMRKEVVMQASRSSSLSETFNFLGGREFLFLNFALFFVSFYTHMLKQSQGFC